MRIDWSELEAAFGSASGGEAVAWLDRETGRLVTASPGHDAARFVAVRGVAAGELARWMSEFAASIADVATRDRVNAALAAGRSFARFQEVLAEDRATRALWYPFHTARLHRALEAWLEEAGIRPEGPPPWRASDAAAATAAAASTASSSTAAAPLRAASSSAAPAPVVPPAATAANAIATLDPALHAAIVARLVSVPLARTLGMRLVRLERGECDLAIDDRRDLDGIFASLHGGILTTLADSAIAFAALTLVGPDEIVTTVELNVRFLAPCREGVLARSRVLKAGRSLVTGTVDLVGLTSGTLFAVSGMTYLRLGPASAPGAVDRRTPSRS